MTQRIATNLLDKIVTTKDARLHPVGPCGWPQWWPLLPDADPPEKDSYGRIVERRLALVVGVFVDDGVVKLVLRCMVSDQPLHTGKASDWTVYR